jgi:hypothetical protein
MFTAVLLKRTIGNHYYDIGVAVAALSISGTFYLALQWMRGSSELRSLFSGIPAAALRDGSDKAV